jgi:hypothetical protein
MHIYINVCIHKYIYTYIHTYTYILTYLHTYIHTHMYSRKCLCSYDICTCSRTCKIHSSRSLRDNSAHVYFQDKALYEKTAQSLVKNAFPFQECDSLSMPGESDSIHPIKAFKRWMKQWYTVSGSWKPQPHCEVCEAYGHDCIVSQPFTRICLTQSVSLLWGLLRCMRKQRSFWPYRCPVQGPLRCPVCMRVSVVSSSVMTPTVPACLPVCFMCMRAHVKMHHWNMGRGHAVDSSYVRLRICVLHACMHTYMNQHTHTRT